MANVNLSIYNPKTTDVTVNSQTVPARQIKTLTIADTTSDAYGFLAQGCSITSVSASADPSKRAEAGLAQELLAHGLG
jgi:hypothetical protein